MVFILSFILYSVLLGAFESAHWHHWSHIYGYLLMYQTPASFLLESAFTPLKTNCKPKLYNLRDENSALCPLLRLTGKQNQNPQTDRWTDWNWEWHGNVVPEVLCSRPHGTAGSKYWARPDSWPSLLLGVTQKQGWQNPPREWGSSPSCPGHLTPGVGPGNGIPLRSVG